MDEPLIYTSQYNGRVIYLLMNFNKKLHNQKFLHNYGPMDQGRGRGEALNQQFGIQ